MSKRRPYVRSMDGWWRRDPYFVRYMAREASSVIVALYAVVLLIGVVRLGQGEAEWNDWLLALKSPWSILFHLLALAVFVYHTWSWFEIMPKTMSLILANGKKLQPGAITYTGVAVAAALTVIILILAMMVKP